MRKNMVSKAEIKNKIRDELKCDNGFIINLEKSNRIQDLQNAYNDNAIPDYHDIMELVYNEYIEYCDIWGLDFEEDNRNNKDYLSR